MAPALILAALPSPSSNGIDVGPLSIRAYGLAIGVGVVLAVVIAQRRWEARDGDADDIASVALWAVPAGLVVEALRIDPATEIAGLRVNTWVSAVVLVTALSVLVFRARSNRPSAPAGDGYSCRQAALVLQSFLDGEADAAAAAEVEDHLEVCRRCGMEADTYREIKAALARSAPVVPDLALRRLQKFGDEVATGGPGHTQASTT